jgi:hypothetical protein
VVCVRLNERPGRYVFAGDADRLDEAALVGLHRVDASDSGIGDDLTERAAEKNRSGRRPRTWQ